MAGGAAAMSIAIEERRIRSLLARVETVEDVARTLPEDDDRRTRLLEVSNAALAQESTVRPVIAARLLGLSEKTIRAWVSAGVITAAQRTPRLLLDLQSVHEVSHILRELREHGKDRDLLDEVWRRLNDASLLTRADLQESIEQMRRGEGRVLRPVREKGPARR
jgi:DNA-binding transcriptional MerR regulator